MQNTSNETHARAVKAGALNTTNPEAPDYFGLVEDAAGDYYPSPLLREALVKIGAEARMSSRREAIKETYIGSFKLPNDANWEQHAEKDKISSEAREDLGANGVSEEDFVAMAIDPDAAGAAWKKRAEAWRSKLDAIVSPQAGQSPASATTANAGHDIGRESYRVLFGSMPPLRHDKDPEKSDVIDFIQHTRPGTSTAKAVSIFNVIRNVKKKIITYDASDRMWRGCDIEDKGARDRRQQVAFTKMVRTIERHEDRIAMLEARLGVPAR